MISTRLLFGIGLVAMAYGLLLGALMLNAWWDRRLERLSGFNRDTLRARRDDDEPRLKKIYGIRREPYPRGW